MPTVVAFRAITRMKARAMIASSLIVLNRRRWLTAAFVVCGLLPLFTVQAANFLVTRGDDPVPVSCSVGDCSLRSAILAANALAGPDAITLPAGTYDLQQLGVGEDASLTGDLDILDELTIQGAGSASTIVYPRDVDRLFDIARGITVTVSGLSIDNTVASSPPIPQRGGGVRSGLFGVGDELQTTLTLSDVAIDNTRSYSNDAVEARGHLFAVRLHLQQTTPDNRIALNFSGPELRVSRSQFIHNGVALVIQLPAAGVAYLHDTQILDGGTENNCNGIALDGTGTGFFDRITVEGVFSFGFGAVCITGGSTASLRDSTLGYNPVGALYVGGGPGTATLNVENSTIAGNGATSTVSMGPGGVMNLLNSTVTFESDSSVTHAIEAFPAGALPAGIINVTNSIIAGGCQGPLTINRFGKNLESPGNTCGLNPGIDLVSVPLANLALSPLANNGGTTKTRLPQAGSLAIAGSNVAGIPFCTSRDQRGYLRPAVCDLGAVDTGGVNERIFADGFEF